MKKLIALALAGTVALTSTATPAVAADRDDQIGAILFGLAALAVLGTAIENRNDRDRPRTEAHNPRPAANPPRQGDGLGIPPRARVLPARCFRRVETREGQAQFYAKRCLRNNYRFADRLPARCETAVRTDRGFRIGYRPRCLHRLGFSRARH